MRRLTRPALFAVVALSIVVLVACGGDSKESSKMSEGRASQVAHAALLETADLSNGEWVLFSTDSFRNDDASLPDTGNCSTARNLAADMSKNNLARAQRALQTEIYGFNSKGQVEMHVRMFDTNATAQDYLRRHRTTATSDAYIRCLQDGFTALFGSNARVRFGDAKSKAPRDGVTSAFDQDLKVGEVFNEIHTDSYAWVQENAFVLVLVSGPRAADTSDVVREALEKTQAKLEAAFKLPQ
jgi:hypothetical protein